MEWKTGSFGFGISATRGLYLSSHFQRAYLCFSAAFIVFWVCIFITGFMGDFLLLVDV